MISNKTKYLPNVGGHMIYYECIKIDIGGMQQNEVQVE
jgi:hypothetical protein